MIETGMIDAQAQREKGGRRRNGKEKHKKMGEMERNDEVHVGEKRGRT